jgi:hypothetical protein
LERIWPRKIVTTVESTRARKSLTRDLKPLAFVTLHAVSAINLFARTGMKIIKKDISNR